MKNLLLGTALSLTTVFSALPAFAQPGDGGRDGRVAQQRHQARAHDGRHHRGHGRGHGNFERHIERMDEALGLTDAQVAQLRRIFEEAREAHRRVGRGPENRDAHRAIRERTQARVDAVLTRDQRAELARLRAEREERRERRHRGDCDGRGERGERGGRGPAARGKR